MEIHSAHIEPVDIRGFLTFAVYINYFVPGSLKIRSIVLIPNYNNIRYSSFNTRRWMQLSESPYPGYCRAPGSEKCIPLLCDCQKLTEIWTKIRETKSKLTTG
ncbi:hypothetical protein evm_000661 [Chilo suppressalis]|nr:hypothetical protein evm_000661 [Chilo suppressalis]